MYDSINEEEVFVIKKPKKKKKKNKGAKDAAGHHVIVKLLDGTDSEGNPISGYCIVDGKTDEIIPFDGNFRENSQDVIAEWNQLRGFERGDVWNLWRYRTQDGHFVEVLPSSKAEEILRKAGNSMNLSKFRFVLLDKETGAFVRGYQVKRRHQAVQRWKSEHQRQADAAIKKWAFSQKSFMDAVFNASNEAKHHGEILRESGLSKILKNFPEAKLGFPVPLERFLKWLRRYELAVAISRKHSAKQEPASQE